MKHDMTVTIILIFIFVISQLLGLFLVAKSINDVTCEVINDSEVCLAEHSTTAVGERPQTKGAGSLIYILVGVAVGTSLLLLIAKYNKTNYWRIWFFAAVWLSVAIALGVILPVWLAWLIAFLLTLWKILRPNIIVYNAAEVLMYAGLAVLIAPILDLLWVIILLVIISIYDIIAVWKSGHMVTMAKFITNSNAFAGLVVPYTTGKKKAISNKMPTKQTLEKGSKEKSAILGGGDIAFPLLFGGVVLQGRVVELVKLGVPFTEALWSSFSVALLIALGASLAIAGLFLFAKKDKFYPAMPYVTAGCMFGWALTFLF